MTFTTAKPGESYDVLAPDGSEIRFLATLAGASAVHCALPVGGVSLAVTHRTVEEVWYFLAGAGDVWRKSDAGEETVAVAPGTCVTNPLGTHFQFRNTGGVALEFVIVTLPPWPGEDEAARVADYWETG